MLKFMMMFQIPDDEATFENSYNDFLALVERMPFIKRRQVVLALGSPMGEPPYYRILEIYFDGQRELETSLMSFSGQEAGKELGRFGGKVHVMIAEVFEDGAPQFTRRPADQSPDDQPDVKPDNQPDDTDNPSSESE